MALCSLISRPSYLPRLRLLAPHFGPQHFALRAGLYVLHLRWLLRNVALKTISFKDFDGSCSQI